MKNFKSSNTNFVFLFFTGSEETNRRLKELETLLANNDIEVKSLTDQLRSARKECEQYCNISESAEVRLREMTEEYDRCKLAMEQKLQSSIEEINTLKTKLMVLNNQLTQQGQMPTDLELREKLAAAERKLEEFDEVKGELEILKTDLQAASEAVQAAEEKYATEIALHSQDVQALARLKEESRKVFENEARLTQEKDSALNALNFEKDAQKDREKSLHQEIEECKARIADLDAQNSLLHEQIQELSDRAAIFHHNTSQGGRDSPDTSIECMNRSLTEEDSRSAEQL